MNTKKQGLLQAAGVSLYCLLVGLSFGQANKFFPKQDPVLAPVLFLILFSASVLICSLIVFYKPYKLFFAGNKKDALDIVVYTALSLFIFAILTFVGLVIFR
jgi:uncharacterized membrane protein YidH (DUF202 family)